MIQQLPYFMKFCAIFVERKQMKLLNIFARTMTKKEW